MGLDRGKLYLVTGLGSARVGNPVADLGGAPYTFVSEPDGSILAVTEHALVEISPEGVVKQLHALNVSGLYPNSMVVMKDRSVYVGMRFFVLSLVPSSNGYEERWLISAPCRKTRLIDWRCDCVAK